MKIIDGIMLAEHCAYRVGYMESGVHCSLFVEFIKNLHTVQWKFFPDFLEMLQFLRIFNRFQVFWARNHRNPLRMTYQVVVTGLAYGRYLCRRKPRQTYIVTIRGSS